VKDPCGRRTSPLFCRRCVVSTVWEEDFFWRGCVRKKAGFLSPCVLSFLSSSSHQGGRILAQSGGRLFTDVGESIQLRQGCMLRKKKL